MCADLHVVAIIEGKPGAAEAIVAAVKPCIEASRQEEGCRRYDLHQDKDRPDRFFIIEHWASEAILQKHSQTPHLKTLVDNLQPLTAKPLEISVLKPLI